MAISKPAKPYTFANGVTADAPEVNSDFDTLYSKINECIDDINSSSATVAADLNQAVKTTSSPTFVKATLSQGTGTAPLTVTSTTKVTNLNADKVDGYDFNQDLQTTASVEFVKATFSQGTGTKPLTVSSQTMVDNLNVELLGGRNSAYHLDCGNFTGTLSRPVTADVTGNVTGNLTGNVTGNLAGDVTSGNAATHLADGTGGVHGAVSTATANMLVRRDGSGNFAANVITASLTGNVTGNTSGSAGSCTGNAATATKLATARAIQGVNFDGSAAINLINGTGYVKATGTTLSYEAGTFVSATVAAKMSYGVVGSDGSSVSGTNFSATHDATGIYSVAYTVAYSVAPSVCITPGPVNQAGITSVVTASSVNGFTVILGVTAPYDTSFSFIAIGPA